MEPLGAAALEPVVAVSVNGEVAALPERAAGSMDATPEDFAAVGLDACPAVTAGVEGIPKPAGDLGASFAEEDFGVPAP